MLGGVGKIVSGHFWNGKRFKSAETIDLATFSSGIVRFKIAIGGD